MFSLSHRQFRGDLALAAGQSGFFFLSKEVNLAGVCQNQCFCIWGPSCLFFSFAFCCMPWPVCGGKKTTWRSLFFPSTMSTGLGSWYQYPLNPQPPWPSSSLKWSQIKLMQHWFQLTAYSLQVKSRKLGVALLVHESGGWCRTPHRSLRKNFHTPYLFITGCGDWL